MPPKSYQQEKEERKRREMSRGLFFSSFVFIVTWISISVGRCSAQATTDPNEVAALNAIFGRWGLTASAKWNFSGEPCSGAAIDSTSFDSTDFNPAIKCDCSFLNRTTCHITQLKVYSKDVVGPIPKELRNLTYLFNLNLAQNYLTGPFPAFIGNLTAMKYLTVGINALSGSIPMELGNLHNLISLGMGTNNFNGSLPPELGNLTSLQQWYLDSSGLGGEIPASLSNLKSMQTIWASDNNFTGKIPEFFGSWTNLTTLRFQGNSFQGPIPSNFSGLKKLSDLRIGDIINGSSSLAFISSMTSLSTLILRNSKITDTLPSNFGQYTNLQELDLSFNNITGLVPQSLFNLSLLSHLFLGNNTLFGSLPAQKSSSLLNIDLSYNQLSGAFPSWVSNQNLQLNLVANNFVIDSSNGSTLPSGLNCLQQDIPCYRGSPVYSSVAIKCGGNRSLTSSDGTVYDIDNAPLMSASYFVTDEKRWAVSNVGSFADASTASYILNSFSQFQNTLDSELFQTARLSASSLRYYGIGLENGNYYIQLQFAEIVIFDPPTWKALGRRVFDIYIQGNLVMKDFDIRKEAGGASFKAVVKKFTASVTNNFLEIHFFWAGKGTCCVPHQGYYGSSISAISVSPFDFIPTVSNKPPGTSHGNKTIGLAVGITAPVAALCIIAIVLIFVRIQRRRKLRMTEEEEFSGMSARPNTFTYAELRTATEDFKIENKLGEGGFGAVFKGKLSDGRLVAVKQLEVASHHGKRQFMTEVATISAVQHRNLVRLYGCCIDGDKRLLVYEYLENKSLDQVLFGKRKLHLDWADRFEICLGTARGLAYLHEESLMRIVHRDVKASNILLDSELNPKISDFGLAKLYDDKKTHISTRVAGTIGYLAPEYAMRGHLTEKADVFAFGVVVLEILSGRPNADPSLATQRVYLLEWAWHLHETHSEVEMMDPMLATFDEAQATRTISVALLCTQASPFLRPPMSRVVAMLVGDIEVTEVAMRPGYLADWPINNVSGTFTSTEGSSSSEFVSNQTTKSCGTPTSQPMLLDSIYEGR